MEMAASKIPQDVREANKNIREAMDIYRNLDRDDPSVWFQLRDIDDKLRFGNINPETYNPWEDDFLVPQMKNDIANDIKRRWGPNQDRGKLVDGEFAAQNYLYIVDHTSEGAALAGGIPGYKGSNRRSLPPSIRSQGISQRSNSKGFKVNWGQATTFIKERLEALQKSAEQLNKHNVVLDGPSGDYKSSTQKPQELTKNQIEFRKYFPGSDPENSASGSASGKGKKASEGTPKAPDVTVNFKSGYDKHLIEVEGFKAKPTIGIKGGHNLENLEKYILDNFGDQVKNINQAVTKTPHPDIPGIYEVKYKLPVYDGLSTANGGKGNFTGQWKEYKNPKTVYDPKVFSDEQILKLGREAMEEGIRSNRIRIDTRPNAVSDELVGYVEVDGKKLQFIGYRDKVTGEITNFFPVIPKN